MTRPPISPDGRWWWDGQQWQSLLSPDGTHRWDGKAWVPVRLAATAPVAAAPGEVPSWLPAESAAALRGPPEFAASTSAPAEPMPSWSAEPKRGRPWVMWGAVAVGAALILLVFLSVKDILPPLPSLPTFDSGKPPARVPARATPDLSLTQHQRADKLINVQLPPTLVDAGQAEQTMVADCGGGHQLDPACRLAMSDTYHKLGAIVDQIDRSDVPPCIQAPLQDFRNRVNLAANDLAQAIQYYDSKDGAHESQLIDDYVRVIQSTAPLAQAVQTAFNACPG